ncbi:MAG: alpha/beta hydrolase [Myxococcota bacterium]
MWGLAWGWMGAWALLLWGVGAAVLVLNSLRPIQRPALVQGISFFASWLTLELVGHHVVAHMVVIGLLVWGGALEHPPGWIGLLLTTLAMLGLLRSWLQARRSTHHMRDMLADLIDGQTPWPSVPWRTLLMPFVPRRWDVDVTEDVVFWRGEGRTLRLDVFAPKAKDRPGDGDGRRPVLMQVHGGGWVIGDKREQGLPLMYHMAAQGWVCFNVNYRLSPAATFPDHLIDLKRALAWIRDHAQTYGIDPDFVAITGGSAGGHLTALMALTANLPRYQPGFTQANTSIQAAVPFYGVYDFTDRLGLMGRTFQRLSEAWIMKAFRDTHPERFREASPIDLVHRNAPPFLVVHGTLDTLAPVAYARLFVERLKATSTQEVRFVELPGAQHAFDVFASPRTVRVIAGVERFLDALWRQARSDRQAPRDAEDDSSSDRAEGAGQEPQPVRVPQGWGSEHVSENA